MDIVERLRKQQWKVFDEMRGLIKDTTAYEAADEIERLREALRQIADHEKTKGLGYFSQLLIARAKAALKEKE